MSYLRELPFNEKDFPTLQLLKEEYGFIPNFFKAQTARPDLIDAEVQLVDAILIREGALTRQRKEYIFLVCSAANLSTYCVTAHCEIIRMMKLAGPEPEQIALDHMSTDLPIVEKALLNFTLKLNNHGLKITQEDIDDLRTCANLEHRRRFGGFGRGRWKDRCPGWHAGSRHKHKRRCGSRGCSRRRLPTHKEEKRDPCQSNPHSRR